MADDTSAAETNTTQPNVTDANTTAPGEQLSGVAGVHAAELDGDLDQRAFGIAVAQAQSEEERADIVADRLADVEDRLQRLEERNAQLDEKHEHRHVSHGMYRAEVAQLSAQTETATQMMNQSERATAGMPAEMLEERNISVERIQMLKHNASELSGPEVREIARGIAGPNAGHTPADNRPVDVPGHEERPGGPPGDGESDDERPGGPPADDRN